MTLPRALLRRDTAPATPPIVALAQALARLAARRQREAESKTSSAQAS